ncbi:MAG: sigma-54-dependent Fis family transcriptional regulator [Leptospiraceae bacterium]|nr:sigma-54-dependent Fis family transcriptional regulator [Leptospiraceae bacterium]
MLPPILTVIVEFVLSVCLVIPAALAVRRNSGNRIHVIFLSLSILIALTFLLDALNRLLLYELIRLTGLFFRLSDAMYLLAGVALVYFGSAFPRRTGSVDGRAFRRGRLFIILMVLSVSGVALIFYSFVRVEKRAFDAATGIFYSTPGWSHILNRIFFLLCIGLSAYEQFRFIHYNPRDPRRLHSRFYIYTTFFLAAGLLLSLPFLWTQKEDVLMAARSALFLIFFILVHNMLANIGISYRARLIRNGLFLLSYVILLVPLIYVINEIITRIDRYQSWSGALILTFVFVGFHLLSNRYMPLLEEFVFSRRSRMDRRIADFNQGILTLETGSAGDIRRQLAEFIETEYEPGFLALYFQSGESGGSQSPVLRRDRLLTRIVDYQSIPPEDFSPPLLRYLAHLRSDQNEVGSLVADLMAQAEKRGDTELTEALAQLAGCGAEILLPLFDERETISDDPADEDAQAVGSIEAMGVAVLGQVRNDRPLDETDLNWLRLLIAPTLLALKNQELFRSTNELKEKLEEENRRITRRLSENIESLSRKGGRAAAFIFNREGSMAQLIAEVERFAGQNSPILITGETGAGKGELARMIHGLSQRDGEFITVNCAAIPDDLIENELFGHEKGAYTGATEARDGLVARAADGTLFLDEIGELPPQGQVKLLRLLQDGEYERIGSSETRRTNARFIFATNRDLEQEVDEGRFRSDLFYRISTFEVRVPPLRERKEDVRLLVEHYLWTAGQNLNRPDLKFTDEALELLEKHSWPGNIRELENLIMRTVVLSEDDLLDVDHLPVMFHDGMDFNHKKNQLQRIQEEQQRLERELLVEAMERCKGNQREAAHLLSISRGSLQYRLKQFGLTNR